MNSCQIDLPFVKRRYFTVLTTLLYAFLNGVTLLLFERLYFTSF